MYMLSDTYFQYVMGQMQKVVRELGRNVSEGGNRSFFWRLKRHGFSF
jgi:hypothetical protein